MTPYDERVGRYSYSTLVAHVSFLRMPRGGGCDDQPATACVSVDADPIITVYKQIMGGFSAFATDVYSKVVQHSPLLRYFCPFHIP